MLSKKLKDTILISVSGAQGERKQLPLASSTLIYRGRYIAQEFSSCLVDNVGTGLCKVAFEPHINFDGVEGYKTLFPKDCFYIDSRISFIEIMFIEPSVVEIVLGAVTYES